MALIALLLFPAIGFSQASALYAKIVKGTVVSASDGEALIGATVRVQGTQTATITDLDGHFSINAEDGQTLNVSYIGYIEKNVKVVGNDLKIALDEEANSSTMLWSSVMVSRRRNSSPVPISILKVTTSPSSTPPTLCRLCRVRHRV